MRAIKISIFIILGSWFAPTLAATVLLNNLDGMDEGFNDNSPPFPNQTNNPGTTLGEQRLIVFQAAADFWGARLESDVIINVNINMDPLFCSPSSAALGQAGATDNYGGFPNAPRADTFYPVSLANSLAGQDLTPDPGPSNNDINATFNSNIDNNTNCLPVNWWLGINSPPAAGTISLFNTVVHELAHGLGFASLISSDGSKLDGFDDSYSINLYDEEMNLSWPDMTNAQRTASMINTGNLVWRGENATNNSNHLSPESRTNGHIRMFAPNPRQPGSSVSHWDTTLNPNELMEPILTLNSDFRTTLQLLRDVGWNLITGSLPPGPGQINFVADSFSAVEGQGPVSILISRSAGSDGAVSVQLTSQDITAIGGEDYDTINERVSWADGETGVKIITVGIINDQLEEGDETAAFQLSVPLGGAAINQSTSLLTIQDAFDPNDPNVGDILNIIVPVLSAINRDR